MAVDLDALKIYPDKKEAKLQIGDQVIENRERLKEAQIVESETKLAVSQEQLEKFQQERADEAYGKVVASLDTMERNKADNIIKNWKDNKLIPPVVFQEVRNAIADDEFSLEDSDSVIDNIKERLGEGAVEFLDDKSTKKQLDYVKELFNKRKYGNLILSGIATSEMNAKLKGKSDYRPLLKILSEASGDIANDAELKNKLEDFGIPHQFLTVGLSQINQVEKNRKILQDAKESGEFQSSFDRLMKENTNKKIDELAKIAAKKAGLFFITEDEREQLISQGIDPSELE